MLFKHFMVAHDSLTFYSFGSFHVVAVVAVARLGRLHIHCIRLVDPDVGLVVLRHEDALVGAVVVQPLSVTATIPM